MVVLLLIGVAATVPSSVEAAPPSNDNIGSATAVPNLGYGSGSGTSQATGEATLQAGEQQPCGSIGKTVWYSYSPSSTTVLRVRTLGSDFDTVLAAYKGTSLGSPNVDCNDDRPSGALWSLIKVPVFAGSTYSIQAGGYGGASGSLSIDFTNIGCSGNDGFGNPCTVDEPLNQLPYRNAQATSGYSTQIGEQQPCGSIGATAWYDYSPAVSGTATVTTSGSDFDTVLAAYLAVPAASVPVANLACNDDVGGTLQSSIAFSVTGGLTYLIQAGGYSGATGNLVVNVA